MTSAHGYRVQHAGRQHREQMASQASARMGDCRLMTCRARDSTGGPYAGPGRELTLGSAGLGRSAELPGAPTGRAAPFACAGVPLASRGEAAGEARPALSCCKGTYTALGCWYRALMTRQTLASSAWVTSNSSHQGGSSGRATCRTTAALGTGVLLPAACLLRADGYCGRAEHSCQHGWSI